MTKNLLKNNIVEKILRDSYGRLVLVKFSVFQDAGRIKARVLSTEYLVEEVLSSAKFFISEFIHKIKSLLVNFQEFFKPLYFTFNSLFQNGSCPRAPTK